MYVFEITNIFRNKNGRLTATVAYYPEDTTENVPVYTDEKGRHYITIDSYGNELNVKVDPAEFGI